MKKAIKISVNGRDAVSLEIEGDDDLVNDLVALDLGKYEPV